MLILLCSCQSKKEVKLHSVTVKEFSQFVKATNYITDAEKYGWSFVQKTVYKYDVVKNISWRNPTGKEKVNPNYPVTQVSYNDAIAYCKWIKKTLPTYKQYWNLSKLDSRPLNFNTIKIYEAAKYNVVGNVWDITLPEKKNQVRLAGGSFLCSENTCNGIVASRELFVDTITANSNIGFSIIQ